MVSNKMCSMFRFFNSYLMDICNILINDHILMCTCKIIIDYLNDHNELELTQKSPFCLFITWHQCNLHTCKSAMTRPCRLQ